MKINEYVLITGASSKLGKLISEVLAKNNYSLLLHYYKSINETISLAKELARRFKNQNFHTIHLDLSKHHSLDSISKALYSKTENIHGVINNASLYERDHINNFHKDNFESNLNIHFRNPVTLISIISEKLSVQNKHGFVINITDEKLNRKNRFSYNISKTLLSNWNNKNIEKDIKITEFKPGNLLPSKNPQKSEQDFKQKFSKLITYNDGHTGR